MTSQFIRTMPALHFPCFCVFSSFLRIALLNGTSSSHGPLSHCPVCLSLIVLLKGRRKVLFALPYVTLRRHQNGASIQSAVTTLSDIKQKTRVSVGMKI